VKKNDESLFDMFQDPIMTMVALILLATLWMILPGESKERSADYYQRKESIDSLRTMVDVIDKEINMLEIQLRRMQRELDWTEDKVAELSEEERKKAEAKAEEFTRNAEQLREKIERRKRELKRLDKMLAKARKKAIHSPRGESIRPIEDSIRTMEGTFDKKIEELADAQQQRREEEKASQDRQAGRDQLQAIKEELAQELKMKKIKRQELEEQLIALTNRPKTDATSGFRQRVPTNKSLYYVHLKGGRLLPVDNLHYSIKTGYWEMDNGKTVRATVKAPLSSAKWETISAISNATSAFLSALNRIDNSEYCIIFLIDTKSFTIFREARSIARKKGFEVGWEPFERDEIILVSKTYAGGDTEVEK
jgi:hypothetical protein